MAAPYSSAPEWSPAAWWNSYGAANDESQLALATVVDRVGAPPPLRYPRGPCRSRTVTRVSAPRFLSQPWPYLVVTPEGHRRLFIQAHAPQLGRRVPAR